MSDALSSDNGALWVQPDGPNTEVYYLDCADVGDLTETEGGIELIRCFKPDGSGWDVKGELKSPPEPITLDVTSLTFRARNWLEKVSCPFGLYLLQTDCGRRDLFYNYVRGDLLTDVRRTGKTRSGVIRQEEDVKTTIATALQAWPPSIPIEELTLDIITTTEAGAGNTVVMNSDRRCEGDCGATLDLCEQGMIGCDTIAAASADCLYSADGGVTWALTGADPFPAVAGNNVMGITRFYIGRDTVRYLAGMDPQALGGGQGLVAYSDNAGGAWTQVTLGGAAADEGPVYGNGLFSLNQSMRHIWLAGNNGSIFFSDDGGATWTQQEAGILTAGVYNCIHFCDEDYGVAGAAAGIVAITSDGGNTWAAATPTGGGAVLCCQRLSADKIWVGDDAGALFYSTDAGVTWTQRVGWLGSGAGDVRDLFFVNDYVAFMVADTVTPEGRVLRTINGGYTWEVIYDGTINNTDDGLNKIWACDESHAIVVGEVEAGSGIMFLGRISPAGE